MATRAEANGHRGAIHGAAERTLARAARPFEGILAQLVFDWRALKAMPKALHYRGVILSSCPTSRSALAP